MAVEVGVMRLARQPGINMHEGCRRQVRVIGTSGHGRTDAADRHDRPHLPRAAHASAPLEPWMELWQAPATVVRKPQGDPRNTACAT
jgi:hypothetical protein